MTGSPRKSFSAAALTGNLLDTNIIILALTRPDRLSPAAREAVEAGPTRLSVISYWEVAIKSMKGNLDVGDPRVWWTEALDQLAADPLPFQPKHVAQILALPAMHGDPFDRALVAQAAEEELTLISTDATLRRYESDRVRILV